MTFIKNIFECYNTIGQLIISPCCTVALFLHFIFIAEHFGRIKSLQLSKSNPIHNYSMIQFLPFSMTHTFKSYQKIVFHIVECKIAIAMFKLMPKTLMAETDLFFWFHFFEHFSGINIASIIM